MKKIIFTLLSFGLLYSSSNAQYCGSTLPSGPTVCQTDTSLHDPGLSPVSDSLAPVVNGYNVAITIDFTNFDTIVFGGQTLTIQQLTVDSINNLPHGTCWSTNKSNPLNTWGNKEQGCIKVVGFVCSPPGQYKLDIFVTANLGGGVSVPTNADAAGLKYFVRVNNPGDTVVPVDTTQTSLTPFRSYPLLSPLTPETAYCSVGIKEIGGNINSLSIYPNPFNSKAIIAFNSDVAGTMTETITDMLGSQVYKSNIEVNMGQNTHVIERGSLAAGVYFYTISDGKSVYTKRMTVSE